jgi:hypothetical protein
MATIAASEFHALRVRLDARLRDSDIVAPCVAIGRRFCPGHFALD